MREVTEEDIDRVLASRVLAWLEMSPTPLSFQHIVKVLNLSQDDQTYFLNPALEFLEQSQKIQSFVDKKGTRRFQATTPNSPVMVARITGRFASGHIKAEPIRWDGAHPPLLSIKKKNHKGLGLEIGDHLLVAVQAVEDTFATVRILQRLSDFKEARLTGRFNGTSITWQKGKLKSSFAVVSSECGGLVKEGDVVEFSLRDDTGQEHPQAHIRRFIFEPNGNVERLGDIALINRGLTDRYPSRIEKIAQDQARRGVRKRDHFFHIDLPFITIDPEHAKDHDDAVYANLRKDGGYDVFIAIADVAHYVRPGSEIDKYARLNGVSNYPLDRVVHMLPQAFSEDLLSLKQHQLRRAIVLQIQIDKDGTVVFCAPHRGIIRVHANLSYETVEGVLSGRFAASNDITKHLESINQAYHALRPSLADDRDLELLNGKILPDIDKTSGRIIGFRERTPLHAHDIIEKLMLLANKSVASLLDASDVPYLRRAHIKPDHYAFREAEHAFEKLGLIPPENGISTPGQLNDLLLQASGDDAISFRARQIIGGLIPKARYTTQAHAHWGLNCESYTHFTSPIRRYADILTHRALITAFPHLGEGGLSEHELRDLDRIADQLNFAEDRAKQIEREVLELYTCALMSGRGNSPLPARILSLQKHGAYLESPAIPYPIKMPARDFKDTKEGDTVSLRISCADPMEGRMEFARVSQQPLTATAKRNPRTSSFFVQPAVKHTKTRNVEATVVRVTPAKTGGGIPHTQITLLLDAKNETTLPARALCSGSLTLRHQNGTYCIYDYENKTSFCEGARLRLVITDVINKKGESETTYRAVPLKDQAKPAVSTPKPAIKIDAFADLGLLIA